MEAKRRQAKSSHSHLHLQSNSWWKFVWSVEIEPMMVCRTARTCVCLCAEGRPCFERYATVLLNFIDQCANPGAGTSWKGSCLSKTLAIDSDTKASLTYRLCRTGEAITNSRRDMFLLRVCPLYIIFPEPAMRCETNCLAANWCQFPWTVWQGLTRMPCHN